MKMRWVQYYLIAVAGVALQSSATEIVLKADRSNVLRSNNRTRNNGANNFLYIAHAPVARSIISFDLSSVTSTVEQAVFRFRQRSSVDSAPDLTIAPMVYSKNNAAWKEGLGRGGMNGQNARLGESCWAFSFFQTVQWEDANGKPLRDAGVAELWGAPVARLETVPWVEGQWMEVDIPAALLETARNLENPVLTLGLWGTSGNGYYFIHSNNSAWPPELVLQLKEKK